MKWLFYAKINKFFSKVFFLDNKRRLEGFASNFQYVRKKFDLLKQLFSGKYGQKEFLEWKKGFEIWMR